MKKRKWFTYILIACVVLVALFLGFVALQPSAFRITRSTTIAAPPAEVFAQVNDFHNWEAWSPWTELDPESKMTFEGPTAGTGAVLTWDGNDKVGAGRMTVTESRPHDLIRIKLEFIRPFESSCTTEFTFEAASEQTQITWTMSGHNDFIGKFFCLFMNMDKMIGDDFEKGLASMKAIVEATER